jgi:Taurine catabolism dioxygenase TauD, TfdA family
MQQICFSSLDDDGKVIRINRSITQRDSFFSQSVKDVRRWYPAMAKFVELLKTEATEFKMEEADFLTFDNTRLVHGR